MGTMLVQIRDAMRTGQGPDVIIGHSVSCSVLGVNNSSMNHQGQTNKS